MTIGKTSSKFLDRSSGLYWRLDDTEASIEGEVSSLQLEQDNGRSGREDEREGCSPPPWGLNEKHEPGMFDFNKGMMEDDGTATLLRRKPSHGSSRWRRRSGSKKKTDGCVEVHPANKENRAPAADWVGQPTPMETEEQARPVLLHFSNKEEADNQVLISEKESKGNSQHVAKELKEAKAVKRNSLRNYTRVIDRAFRRGWKTFVTNLHSVTLMPISSSPSASSSPGKIHRELTIAEYR